jgi:lysophospholipase L1-like esterase
VVRLRASFAARRNTGLRLATAALLSVVTVVAIMLSSSSTQPAGATLNPSQPTFHVATCSDSAATGASEQWSVRYKSTTASPHQQSIRVVSVDSPPSEDTTSQGLWTVSWTKPGQQAKSSQLTATKLQTEVIPASPAHLLAPDDDCSLDLSASFRPASVAVIGDSVFANIRNSLASGKVHGAFASSWQIDAVSGFGWSASAPDWPLTTIRGSWAIGLARGLFPDHASTLVVELGANDALRAVFADMRNNLDLAKSIRSAVGQNVNQLLNASTKAVACTVVVTPPDAPTGLFGVTGSVYVSEAKQMDAIIKTEAARFAKSGVVVADWSTFSAGHHLKPTSSANWFSPGEGIHPNVVGQAALLNLVQRSMRNCPSGH